MMTSDVWDAAELHGGGRNRNNKNNGSGKGNGNGKGKGKGKGNKGNKDGKGGKGGNREDAVTCNYINGALEMGNSTSSRSRLENLREWYDEFFRAFKTSRLEWLDSNAQKRNVPLQAQFLVSKAKVVVADMLRWKTLLEKDLTDLRIKAEQDEEKFMDSETRVKVDEKDSSDIYERLFLARRLKYRYTFLHEILVRHNSLMRSLVADHLGKREGEVPDIDPVFHRVDYSYSSYKFYVTYGTSVSDQTVVFTVPRPSLNTTDFEKSERPVKTPQDIEPGAVTIVNSTPMQIKDALFERSVSRGTPSRIRKSRSASRRRSRSRRRSTY